MKPLTQSIIGLDGRLVVVTQPRNNLGQFQSPTQVFRGSNVMLNSTNAECVIVHTFDKRVGIQLVSVFSEKSRLIQFGNWGLKLSDTDKKDNYAVLRNF